MKDIIFLIIALFVLVSVSGNTFVQEWSQYIETGRLCINIGSIDIGSGTLNATLTVTFNYTKVSSNYDIAFAIRDL